MSLAFRNEIDIRVALAGDVIADVAIRPRSRPPLTRLFAGKPAASLLSVMPRLFSLCSAAHQVACLSALEAARGEQPSAETSQRRAAMVVAERLCELLRGLFFGPLGLDPESAVAVRVVMQATSVLIAGEGLSRRDVVAQIRTALDALRIAGDESTPAAGSALARYLASFDGNVLSLPPTAQSFLSAADDRDVVTRMLAQGPAFSDAPDLHGSVPETGVWARRAGREPVLPSGAVPGERLRARVTEIAGLCAWLEDDGEVLEDDAIARHGLGTGRGAAAVECARGRLYHALELDNEDRIVRFDFLAPTEWNFHSHGPLVRNLQGSRLTAGQQGRDAVRAFVGSFDPCVGFKLGFREVGHA